MKLNSKLFSVAASAMILIGLEAAASANSSVSIDIPPDSAKSCVEAISSVEAELTEKGFFSPWEGDFGGQMIQVTPERRTSTSDIESSYHGFPTERSHSVIFQLSGEALKVYGLLNSPQLMSILSAQIMSDCTQVGLVRFDHWFEGSVPVGFFSDNTVRPFTEVTWGRVSGFVSEDDINIRTLGTGSGARKVYPWGYYLVL